MRIDSPLMTNAIVTGSFSGSFTGAFDGDITADSVAYADVTGKPTLISGSAQVVALVEAGTDSNTFTDADHTKLNGIEASADVTDSTNVTAAGALMDSELAEIATVKALTAAGISGSLSAAALVALGADIISGSASDVRTFLNVEDGATGDQSNAEIRTAVEAATDSNVFTDADHTKLNGIEASADVTDTDNVTAAGALMDSEVSALALIKGLTAAQISGSGNVRFEALNAATSSYALKSGASIVSASVLSSPSQGTIRLATNGVNTDVDSGLQSGDSPTFSGLAITNDVTINGNLNVLGTKTELQVATLNVEDKNILIASGAADSAAADGAGLSIDGADKALTWNHANTRFNFDAPLNVAGNITTSGTVDGRDVASDGSKLDGIAANANNYVLPTNLAGDDIDIDTTALTGATVISDLDINITTDTSGRVTDANGSVATRTLTKGDLGLGNVENTALSTYTGNGGALDNQYITNGAGYITGVTNISGNAGTATTLQTARSIAGVSFNGGADISLNNNNITNGAGYTTYSANQGLDNNDNVHFEGLMVGQTSGATANTIRCVGDVVAFYSSDEQFKDNVVQLDGALDKINQIRGVEFDWNDKQDVYEGHDIGVIAQEVEKVYPELVHYREHSDSKAVDYVKLTAVLIEAVKELSAKVKELENK